MLWATEELFTVWLQFTISSELAAGPSTRATLEPGTGVDNWEQRTLEHWDCYDTRCSGCITAAAGSRGRGSFPLHLQFCISLHFLTARVPHSHSQSHLCCCYFIPEDSNREPEHTGIKTESLAMLMSVHIAGNNSAPSGVSGQSHMYLCLFSHCSNKDSYPKGTRGWSLWHGCSPLAFWMTLKQSD